MTRSPTPRAAVRGARRALPLALASAALLAAGCAPAATRAVPSDASAPPAVQREFRGVWVASVANIDWPSRPGLSSAEQQAELLQLLDRAVALRLNAVILQVRPMGDAFYASPHEPWSEYLTGEMGRAPEPFYDPLAFAVAEAHRRGLELHAWFNPYRASHPSAASAASADHISRARPELVRRYGSYLWMDPGEPQVQEHTLAVILDVVRRYDIDGVHIDDYFYPYPENDAEGRPLPFPDDSSHARYRAAGGRLARDDWRRENVDVLVERLYREIRREKPWVKFGISPFGIWRPGHPPQIRTAFDQYADIYADARRWLVEGWVDYFTPQLYWPIAQTPQSYPVLLRWWVEQNPRGRHLWPGNFTSRVVTGGTPLWPAREVLAQVYVTRGQAGATGNVHFSMRALMADPDSLATQLAEEAYAEPALVPASPWLARGRPGAPRLARGPGDTTLALQPGRGSPPTWWVVRTRRGAAWRTEIVPGWRRSHPLPAGTEEAVVTAVDRVGTEGPAARLNVRG